MTTILELLKKAFPFFAIFWNSISTRLYLIKYFTKKSKIWHSYCTIWVLWDVEVLSTYDKYIPRYRGAKLAENKTSHDFNIKYPIYDTSYQLENCVILKGIYMWILHLNFKMVKFLVLAQWIFQKSLSKQFLYLVLMSPNEIQF